MGFIDLIRHADVFVIYDSMQFTKNDWRNRNLINCNNSAHWITIPCGQNISRSIDEVYPINNDWAKKHWQTIRHCYARSRYWNLYSRDLENIFTSLGGDSLSNVNYALLKYILEVEQIGTLIVRDVDIIPRKILASMERTERLIQICLELSASGYLSAPAAKNYLNVSEFQAKNIPVRFYDYPIYKSQATMTGLARPNLSWVDTLMNWGRLF